MSENNNLINKEQENTTCIKKIINLCCKKQIKSRSFHQTNNPDEEDHGIVLCTKNNLTESLLADLEAPNTPYELNNDNKQNSDKISDEPKSLFFKETVSLGLPSDRNSLITQKPEGHTLFALGLEEQVKLTERSEEKELSTQRSEEPLLFNQIPEEKLLDTQSLVVDSLRGSSILSNPEDYDENNITSVERKRYQLKHNGFKGDNNAFQSSFKTEWKKDRILAISGKTYMWEKKLYEYSINHRKVIGVYNKLNSCSIIQKTSDNKSIFLSFGSSNNIFQLNSRSLKLITNFNMKKYAEASLITHDNKFFFILQDTENIRKYSIDTGKLLYEFEEKSVIFLQFSFCSLDNKYLLMAMETPGSLTGNSESEDKQYNARLGIFDIQNDCMIRRLKVGRGGMVCSVAFKNNNEHAYLTDQYQNVYMLNMKTFDISMIFESKLEKMIYGNGYSDDYSEPGGEDAPYGMKLIKEERNLLLCAADRSIVIDLETKEIIKKFNFFVYKPEFIINFENEQKMELINDGKIACLIFNYGDIVIIDLETQKIIDYHGDFLNGEQISETALMQN